MYPAPADPPSVVPYHPLRHSGSHYLLAVLLLVLMFALTLGSMVQESPTMEEGPTLARGWAFWRSGEVLPAKRPPLMSHLGGLLALLEPNLPHPQHLAGWSERSLAELGREFLWERGVDAARVTFLVRMATVWLAVLVGALVWRWGRDVHGLRGAALALTLFVLSPNVLAHAGLAAGDLGAAVFYVAALYAWGCYLRRRTVGWMIASGVLFGLAQAAGFTALLLIPTLPLMALAQWRQHHKVGMKHASRRPTVLALLLVGLIGVLVVWAAYGFSLGVLGAGGYVGDLTRFFTPSSDAPRAYLLGRYSPYGWWYYPLIALGIKEPLAILLLLAAAGAIAAARGVAAEEWGVLLPAALFALGALFLPSGGVRYLLPLLPLLYLFAARLLAERRRVGWPGRIAVGLLILWLLIANLRTFPHYLAFFNLVAGGPDSGARALVNADLDWGQDLPALARYLKQRGAGAIYLAYYGQADPAAYGIDYVALPTDPPLPTEAPRAAFHPLYPAPGLYAISATHLMGAAERVGDTYAYFRSRSPLTRIGHSIYVYEVPPFLPAGGEETAWFAQCTVPAPAESTATLADLTGIESLRVLPFDCQQSLPFPVGVGWLLLPADVAPLVDLGSPDYTAHYADGSPRYHVWLMEAPPAPPPSSVEFPAVPLPLPIAGHVELLGYTVSAGSVAPGETLILTAWWRVREPPPPPVAIFAHLLAADGSLVQAADGLGISAEEWRPGMVFIQQHRFPISADLAPGNYTLAVGLYVPTTGERFVVSQSGERVVDRIALRGVQVTAAGR